MRALINIEVPQNPDGSYLTNKQLRKILDTLGQRPIDMPDYPDNALDSAPDPVIEESIRMVSMKKAERIIERLPMNFDHHTPDVQEQARLDARKEHARSCIFYAGTLADSGSDFMVTRESNGIMRIRLLNHKIEDLQEGCEDLIKMIEKRNRILLLNRLLNRHRPSFDHTLLRLRETIKIFEHGLEESTINGVLVKGIARRVRYLWSRAALESLLAVIGLFAFAFSFALLQGNVLSPEGQWRGQVERLSTAMATTSIVSMISVVSAMARKPSVLWSASYDRNRHR